MTSDDHGSSVAIEDVEDVSHDSSSNSDINQQFEVVFRPDASYRRKSSLVDTDNPKIARHRDSSDRNTACFVHSLLAGDWEPKGHKLEDIEEDRSQPADEPSNDRTHSNEEDHVSTVDYARKQLEEAAPTVVESRQLTKKQLSDMAWNVRKLSKKLGSVKLKLSVKSVFLVTKAHDESLISLTREVCQWLLSKERDRPYIVYVERRLQKHPDFDADGLIRDEPSAAGRLHYWDGELAHDQPHLFDFVITLGGDGTVLYTSWLFQRVVPPVLSFSLGSLGFLTKFDFPHYKETLTSAFRDGIIVSLRLRFECTIMRSKPEIEDKEGKKHVLQNRDLVEELIGEDFEDSVTHTPDKVYEILNDVVLDRGPNPTMSAIELFGDDEHFTTVLADGVCVSTPTGSTAYNLAAGGSLSHPENPVMLVTAICAHTLSFRPIILPDTIVLRMGVPYDARTTSWASFDGRERHELHPGDYVTVSASRYPFANVLPAGRRSEDWIHGISKTLNWNSRQRQKSFREPHTQP